MTAERRGFCLAFGLMLPALESFRDRLSLTTRVVNHFVCPEGFQIHIESGDFSFSERIRQLADLGCHCDLLSP